MSSPIRMEQSHKNAFPDTCCRSEIDIALKEGIVLLPTKAKNAANGPEHTGRPVKANRQSGYWPACQSPEMSLACLLFW